MSTNAETVEPREAQAGVLDVDLPDARPRVAEILASLFRPIEAAFNRVYGSQWNPLYKSGPIAVALLAITLVTGIYLFLFYRVADPYGSVAQLDSTWHGSWMRSLHRYASDLAVLAVFVHAFKMLIAGKTWGPRALAWRTGILLLGAVFFCGWTGLVMAWDVQGQWIAWEGARLADLLPLFSEPISRSFVRPDSVGKGFFFTNLFLHVALPLGVAAMFWLHASRVARPSLGPPKKMFWWIVAIVGGLAAIVPVPLPPEADLLARPVDVPLDVFYAFWLPIAGVLPAWGHLLFWVALGGVAFTIPNWWKPRRTESPPSFVDEQRCTGCSTCYEDCPFDAISMVERAVASSLSQTVARVDSAMCVSCGICSGSCAPMGVGPANRTGLEQLKRVRELVERLPPLDGEVAVVTCRYSLGQRIAELTGEGVVVVSGCSGSVHTSSLEGLLQGGAAGVLVISCPERDCLYREGPKWLEERMYHDREAELQARVDRRRVRVAAFGPGEVRRAVEHAREFRRSLEGLEGQGAVTVSEDGRDCEVRDAYL